MRRAEGVVHVGLGQRRQVAAELSVVVGLARLPAGVLQHQHFAGLAAPAPSLARPPPPHLRPESRACPAARQAVPKPVPATSRARGPWAAPGASTAPAAAPFPRSSSIVGSAALIRASSLTSPPSSGTLKSTRTSTRVPSCTSRSRTLRLPRGGAACTTGLGAARGPPVRARPDPRRGWSSPTRCHTRRQPSPGGRRSPS